MPTTTPPEVIKTLMDTCEKFTMGDCGGANCHRDDDGRPSCSARHALDILERWEGLIEKSRQALSRIEDRRESGDKITKSDYNQIGRALKLIDAEAETP